MKEEEKKEGGEDQSRLSFCLPRSKPAMLSQQVSYRSEQWDAGSMCVYIKQRVPPRLLEPILVPMPEAKGVPKPAWDPGTEKESRRALTLRAASHSGGGGLK